MLGPYVTDPHALPAPPASPLPVRVEAKALPAAPANRPRYAPGIGSQGFGGWTPGWSDRWDLRREVGEPGGVSVVSIILRWLKLQMPQGSWSVGRQSAKDKWTPNPKHPLAQIIARPNPWWSWSATMAGTVDWLIRKGEAYWLKARDRTGEVVEVYWTPNPQITPIRGSARPIDGYLYNPPGSTGSFTSGRFYETWDVVHFRLQPDPNDPIGGASPLDAQMPNMAAMKAGETYTAAVMKNRGAGKLASPKEVVGGIMEQSPEEAEMIALTSKLQRDTTGASAGGVTWTSLPVDLIDTGMGPEQLLLDRILDRPEAYLCAALNLNSLALDLPSSASTRTYSNKGEAKREAWEQGVIPVQDSMAEAIGDQLLHKIDETGGRLPEWPDLADDKVWVDRKEIEALKEAATEKTGRATQVFSSNMATRDDARSMADLAPIGGSIGQQLYDGTVVGEDGEPEAPALPPGTDPHAVPNDGAAAADGVPPAVAARMGGNGHAVGNGSAS
jgi:hypothetical protein